MIVVSHIAIMVDDLDSMEQFYCAAFRMRTVWKEDGVKCYLTTGNHDILGLLTGQAEAQPRFGADLEAVDLKGPETPSFFHFGTIVTTLTEFESVKKHLEDQGLVVSGIRTSRDTTRSFYCLDPEGNALQVAYVPATYFKS